jgi:hypothetical protein
VSGEWRLLVLLVVLVVVMTMLRPPLGLQYYGERGSEMRWIEQEASLKTK